MYTNTANMYTNTLFEHIDKFKTFNSLIILFLRYRWDNVASIHYKMRIRIRR